jgi:ABC-type polysaccharide/polyol phosphate export permease
MTEGMRRVADYLPLTYVVEALQHPWLGSGSNGSELLVLIAILIVAAGLSFRLLRST